VAGKKEIQPSVKRMMSGSRIGTGKLGAYCESSFFHTAPAPLELKKVYYVEHKVGNRTKKVELPLKGNIKTGGALPLLWELHIDGKKYPLPIQSETRVQIVMDGKPLDFLVGTNNSLQRVARTIKREREKRAYAGKKALDCFKQKNSQSHLFWLAERIGHKLMDYHGLTNRHIGSEVSAKIPVPEKSGKLKPGTEIASRDVVLYGKDARGRRIAFTFEIQPKMELRNLNKVWYGLETDLVLEDKHTQIKNKHTQLENSIILTTRITPEVLSYLGLSKARRGEYVATGTVNTEKLHTLSEVLTSEQLERMYRVLAMRPMTREEREETLRNPLKKRISDFATSLKRTVFAIAENDGSRIRQFIVFRENEHGQLAPRIIDDEVADDLIYRAKQRKAAEDAPYLSAADQAEFLRIKQRLEKNAAGDSA